MKNFLTFFLIFISIAANAFSRVDDVDGFYVGVDPSKTNNKIGNANHAVSLDSKIAEDRYYGYKFSGNGFFLAPEVFMQNGNNVAPNQISSSSTNSSSPNQVGGIPGVAYDVKANVGYEFNHYVSGFVSYDLGSFAYNPRQKTVVVGSNRATNSAVGIGSQINISSSFGVKLMYSQQQFESSAVGGAQVRSEVVKLGTVYSF